MNRTKIAGQAFAEVLAVDPQAAQQAAARLQRMVKDAPRPRDRALIEASVSKAAMYGTARGLAALQMEVLLDIRDLLGEIAVGMSELRAEVCE